MLVIAFIVTVLYPFILKFIEKDDVQLLNETTDTNLAIKIRKKLKRNRIIILILMLILYAIFEVVTTIVFTNFEDPQNVGDLIRNIGLTGVAMYIYLRKQNGAIKAVGNISTSSKHDFLEQHNKYCLFLRGFEQDDYGHDPVVSEKTYDSFSEYEFTSLVMQNIPICAVGMTKEVNSPRGATRVYLNDDSWQKDVLELMEKSQAIYILVNDRKSCIWEIEQSFKMLDKTVYIIDDIQKYENVRQQLAHIISLPKIPNPQKSDKNIFVMTYLNEDFDIKSYKNNIEGYSLALGTESHELKKKSKSRKILQGCLIGIFAPLIIIIFITYLCVLYNYDKQDETYYTEESKTSNGFVENVLSSTSIPVDSLDFMIVYFNNDICHSYATKHFDNRTETDFNTFLSNERENINQSSLVFLLYDGSPNAFTASCPITIALFIYISLF